MSIYNDVAVRKTVGELVAARNETARRYGELFGMRDRANGALKDLLRYPPALHFRDQDSVEAKVAELDRRCWRDLFEFTGLGAIMDQQAVAEFERSLEQACPPAFTMENIEATAVQFSAEADMVFARGLVNIFQLLSNKYKSNDPFKIPAKCVMDWMVGPGWKRGLQVRYGDAEQKLRDLDRVITKLDGKPFDQNRLLAGLNAALDQGRDYWDAYYKIRGFKNGNLHIWFNRPDLIDKANDIIADWYGSNSIGHRNA